MSQAVKQRPAVTDRDFGPRANRPGEDNSPEADGKKRGKPKKEKKVKEKKVKEKKVKPPKPAKKKAPKEPKVKEPKVKEPKVKKSKDDPDAPPRIKKRTHPIVVFFLSFLFFVLVLAVGAGALYLDIAGIKEPFNEIFNITPLAVEIQESIFLDREAEQDEREAMLDEWEEDLLYRLDDVETREADVEFREEQLISEREAMDADYEAQMEELLIQREALEAMLTGKQTLDDMIKTFDKMDADQAASILSGLLESNYELAMAVFSGQKAAKKAAILAALPVADATLFVESVELVTE